MLDFSTFTMDITLMMHQCCRGPMLFTLTFLDFPFNQLLVFLCERCFEGKIFYKCDCMVFLHINTIQMPLNQSGLQLKV